MTTYAPIRINAEPRSCNVGAGSLNTTIPKIKETTGARSRIVDALDTLINFILQYQERT